MIEGSGLLDFSNRFQSAIEQSGLMTLAGHSSSAIEQHSLHHLLGANSGSFGIGALARAFEPYRDLLNTVRDQHASSLQAITGIAQELQLREQASEAARGQLVEFEARTSIATHDFAELDVAPPAAPIPKNAGAADKRNWSAIPTLLLYLILQVLIEWETVRMNLVDINARIPATAQFSEDREYIRTELAGKPGDFRIVTGSSVALRDGPGMKSGVILRLPYQAVVVVLEKEDRTWRYVSYEHNGFVIDGYVSSKFLKKAR